MKTNMIMELKGIVENMKAEIVRVEEIIATLEAEETTVEEVAVKEALTAQDVEDAFFDIDSELAGCLKGLISYNGQVTIGDIEFVSNNLYERCYDADGNVDHCLSDLVTTKVQKAINRLTIVEKMDDMEKGSLTYYLVEREVADIHLDLLDEESDEYHNQFRAWEVADMMVDRIKEEESAFGNGVQSMINVGVL